MSEGKKARELLRVEDWVEAYVSASGNKLIRKGGDWVGPCPVCEDGEDRFSLSSRSDGGTKVNCRYCKANMEGMSKVSWKVSPSQGERNDELLNTEEYRT